MGFTPTQKATLRLRLGYSERYKDVDSALEFALRSFESSEAEIVAMQGLIESELAVCVAIDGLITGAIPRLQAVKVGTIELPGGMEIAQLRSLGRQAVGRICTVLGVERRHDVFSGNAPKSRQGTRGTFYPSGGGSNLPPLG